MVDAITITARENQFEWFKRLCLDERFNRLDGHTELPSFRLRRIRGRFCGLRVAFQADHFVTDAVRNGGLGVEEAVALAILLNSLGTLAGAFGHHVDERLLGFEDL